MHAESRIIRLFPGYAGTVLWVWSGIIEYDESQLSAALIDALREWEILGEREGLTGVPLSADVKAAWSQEGERLARALALELGSGFTIEMKCGPSPVLATSEEPPTNPEAAGVFESRRVASVAKRIRWQETLAAMTPEERGSIRYAPLTRRSDVVPDATP